MSRSSAKQRAPTEAAANANEVAIASSTETRDDADLGWLRSRELMDRIAVEVFKGVVAAVQGALRGETLLPQPTAPAPPTSEPANDVMTADEVAEFLGLDRNTVYDFAGRGEIPHQRLGKRLLFRRGALVSWLDASLCKATLTRKAR